MSRMFIAIAAVLTAAAIGSDTQAASYGNIDGQARRLQSLSSKLYWEFKAHYTHTPEYGHLRSDSSRMYYLAKHIHELAHRRHGLNHMEHDLRKLDDLFHHVERLVKEIEYEASHGHGHVHGDTRHVRQLLHQMEHTLHDLQRDVDHMLSHRHVIQPPHHGGHGHKQKHRRVIRFGGKGWSIKLGH